MYDADHYTQFIKVRYIMKPLLARVHNDAIKSNAKALITHTRDTKKGESSYEKLSGANRSSSANYHFSRRDVTSLQNAKFNESK